MKFRKTNLIMWKLYDRNPFLYPSRMCSNWCRKSERNEQNKRKYINRSAYEAHTFWSTSQSQLQILGIETTTNISISFLYDFNRSLPFKFAFMKIGPRVGTRYRVAKNDKVESPKHE